jgi:hypothetical protein
MELSNTVLSAPSIRKFTELVLLWSSPWQDGGMGCEQGLVWLLWSAQIPSVEVCARENMSTNTGGYFSSMGGFF